MSTAYSCLSGGPELVSKGSKSSQDFRDCLRAKLVTYSSVVCSVGLPRPVLLLDARVVLLLCWLLCWSSAIQMETLAQVSNPTKHSRLSATWHTGKPCWPDVSGLWFSLDNLFVQLDSTDVGVWHFKHGLQKELLLFQTRRPTFWIIVLDQESFNNLGINKSHTMMDLSPRAPVFLSRAILAMALKASWCTLSSHWNQKQCRLI